MLIRFIFIAILLYHSAMVAKCQNTSSYTIQFVNDNIKIDGALYESIWHNTPKMSHFIATSPTPGIAASQITEVQMIYDYNAIYVGVTLYDDMTQATQLLCKRDECYNFTDVFYVYFDTYHDGQNALCFGVSSRGVQDDYKFDANNTDASWDAIWTSAVQLYDDRWTIEMRIPYAALRFPDKKTQEWGLNFMRQVRRTRETSHWSAIDPIRDDFINQFNTLHGLHNIQAPPRIFLNPYITAYHDIYTTKDSNKKRYSFKGGTDLKIGLNESFTLDMTLIPDFGQVINDRLIYNLGPTEIYYQENRPFFTEGTELFGKSEDLFYTRRIGYPSNHFYNKYDYKNLIYNSLDFKNTQLLNAFKITGKTPQGTGIGLFNAITNRSTIQVTDTMGNSFRAVYEPLSNYNAIVIDQPLRNNGFINIMNTNVYRTDHGRLANVIAFNTRQANKKNNFGWSGNINISNIQTFEKGLKDISSGKSYELAIARINKQFTYTIGHEAYDKLYTHNDMGYLDINDRRESWLMLDYSLYKPTKLYNWQNNNIYISYKTLWNINKFSDFSITMRRNMTFKNFLTAGTHIKFHPMGRNDYYEDRIAGGEYYRVPITYELGNFWSSNYSKPVAVDFQWQYIQWIGEKNRMKYACSFSPRFTLGTRILIIPSIDIQYYSNQRAYIDYDYDKGKSIFGERDLWNITNGVRTDFILTHRMSISMDLRHYWLQSAYDHAFYLRNDGILTLQDHIDILSYNFNTSYFNFDIFYNWQFVAGGWLTLAYKNQISQFNNNIEKGYWYTIQQLKNNDNIQNISLRVNYWIDYSNIKKK